MPEGVHYYSYGSYLIHANKRGGFFEAADGQGDLGRMRLQAECNEQALEKAAKKICNLKCGLCPLQEEDFRGCPVACHEEVRPWQCWVAHFKCLATLAG
ncbi:MAG: hypothetical protein C0613_02025 [Desulfobulbaceae bacterium]|nr:MAG: hypothetical protein C0613_02025 [Desulfobulbaceae bacterium]